MRRYDSLVYVHLKKKRRQERRLYGYRTDKPHRAHSQPAATAWQAYHGSYHTSRDRRHNYSQWHPAATKAIFSFSPTATFSIHQ